MPKRRNGEIVVYIGTYTRKSSPGRGQSEGIYTGRFDPSTGKLTLGGVIKGLDNPSFLALDSDQRYLYVVEETDDYEGVFSGAVSAFAINPLSGDLTYLNRQSSHGAAPCHLTVDDTGGCLLVANYTSGTVSVYPIEEFGQLAPASQVIQHKGSSLDANRQQGPHAHSVNIDPSNRFVYVADLGIDQVMIYQLMPDKCKLKPAAMPSVAVQGGAGPRHFTFHPSGRFAYLINELNSTITAFTHLKAQGELAEFQTVPALPADFEGTSHTADIHVHPTGNFLYGSNRGHNSIVCYAIDPETGRLTYVAHESTQGRTPRNFAIDSSGSYLLAANQDTDSIVIFHINQQTGVLTPTGHIVDVPTPVCIKMIHVS